MIYKIIGWSRDAVGNVVKYHLKDICNTLTSFLGGGKFKDSKTDLGNTTPYILIEYE